MSEDDNKNRPQGSRPEDGFGLPPITGLGGGLPGMPGGGLPPSERVGAGMGATPGAGRTDDEEDAERLRRRRDADKEAMIEAIVAAPAPGTAAKEEKKEVKKKEPEKKPEESLAGVIDTFEAIVIALILALTFRAFVVEAFVIPTGSMAPTLLGAHFNAICPKCGYTFAENADLRYQLNPNTGKVESAQPGEGHAELTDSTAVAAPPYRQCPNCGYEIHARELPEKGRDPVGTAQFPWTNNGDRILVLKYLYSVLEPRRFDVIVFKEPMHARDNYIKRLIGLPGETIEIIGGDVFVGHGQEGATDPAKRMIVRKPHSIQDAVWQIVYDNDYLPIDAGMNDRKRRDPADITSVVEDRVAWKNPWSGGQGEPWNLDHSDIVYTGDKPGTLEFGKGLPWYENFYTHNVLGYNNGEIAKANMNMLLPVGDLHLEAEWTPAHDGEELSIIIGKPDNRWRATLQSDGAPKLERWSESTRTYSQMTEMDRTTTAPTHPGVARRLIMNNVDRKVEFFVDGKLLASYETAWSAAQALENIRSEEPQRAEISVTSSGACKIAHLKLLRDLYYTQATDSNRKPTGVAGNPVTLGEDEFFALGDNSTNSLDGRLWHTVAPGVFPALDDLGTRYGVVPRRYLLGKAFFVYWPAGARAPASWSFIPLIRRLPSIPNTGEMRLIR